MSMAVMNGMNSLQFAGKDEVVFGKRKAEDMNGANSFPLADIWTSIEESKKTAPTSDLLPPYVHPRLRRSISMLSQESLEICTESLGSETGSDGFFGIDGMFSSLDSSDETEEKLVRELGDEEFSGKEEKKPLAVVNYHCSINRSSPVRLFPPPLPSICRRDGPCVQMRQQRKDGRLLVHAIPAPSQNYLHCQREGGHLILSFIETTFEEIYPEIENPVVTRKKQVSEVMSKEEQTEVVHELEEEEDEIEEEEEEDEEEEDDEIEEEEEEEEEEDDEIEEGEGEEEEEVEVVDRGIMVEVKVSSLPQLITGGMKVHRSSLVINKFVGGTPVLDNSAPVRTLGISSSDTKTIKTTEETVQTPAKLSIMTEVDCWGSGNLNFATTTSQDNNNNNKLLFTSKKTMNREALLHQVRRCSEYNKKPLFFWEPCCIATS